MFTITIAGHVCADLTPDLPLGIGMIPGQLSSVGPLAIRAGGCVANTGLVLAGLGVGVRTSALVGDDDLGSIVVRELDQMGLSTENVVAVPGGTTSYSIVIEPAGMNRSFWHHTGAGEDFDGRHVDLDGVDLLHVGYPPLLPGLLPRDAQPLVDLLARGQAEGATTSLDMAVVDRSSEIGRLDWHSIVKRALAHTDIFTPSIDDLMSMLEIGEVTTKEDVVTLAERLIADGAAVVMLSAGEDGLLIRTAGADRLARGGRVLAALGPEWADATVWAAAREIPTIVTTNGAGDSATAGLLFGIATGLSPQKTADTATLVASQWIQNIPIQAAEASAL